MKFYVAASLKHEAAAKAVMDALRARGHEITFDWVAEEERGVEWTDEKRRAVAEMEIDGAADADALVFIAPGGRGAHCELGAALALGVPVLLVGDWEFSLFYYHPGVTWLRGVTHGNLTDDRHGTAFADIVAQRAEHLAWT
jgi:nucleoside 2-deoxyribosyltransferase